MPLTAEQTAALETLATADAEEVAEALKSSANALYQTVFRAGHSTATQAAKAKREAVEQQLAAEKERADAAEAQVVAIRDKAPDAEALNADWQKKLDREIAREREAREAAEAKVARLTTDTVVERTENALLAAGIRPRIAKLLAKDAAGRIAWDDSGAPVLYEPGTQIPVQIPAGKTAFDVLAEAEKAQADPADLVSSADRGSGIGGGAAGGGYDPAAAGRAMAEQTRAADTSLAFR